ncbi:MAG TPA: 16S rRNA (guanine(966)-N(2))-methyltransferase RsmD [Oligoflexia bacterium]|nr:16S rRNA (guanine(966)-N(2))-methyltransferase RsmD [Oligoflexia bacterium]
MRIVAGKLKGRRFPELKSTAVRPTTDRTREAVFSTLNSLCTIADARVLDLYAGSGALGFEALSRGAHCACMVERDRRTAAQLIALAGHFGVQDQVQVVCEDVLVFLEPKLRRSECSLEPGECFGLVFADPPYASHPAAALLRALGDSRLLAHGAVVVVEGTGKEQSGEALLAEISAVSSAVFSLSKTKHYGSTVVSYFQVAYL